MKRFIQSIWKIILQIFHRLLIWKNIRKSNTYHAFWFHGKSVDEIKSLTIYLGFKKYSSIALIPKNSIDVKFIFPEHDRNFLPVTVKGIITYEIKKPVENTNRSICNDYDFTVNKNLQFKNDPIEKINQRLVDFLQTFLSNQIPQQKFEDLNMQNLKQSLDSKLKDIGLEVNILAVTITSIKPSNEILKKLETIAIDKLTAKAKLNIEKTAALEQN